MSHFVQLITQTEKVDLAKQLAPFMDGRARNTLGRKWHGYAWPFPGRSVAFYNVRLLLGHAAPRCLQGDYFTAPWSLCKQESTKLEKQIVFLFANHGRIRTRFALEGARLRGLFPNDYSVARRIGVKV
jgi:hypothetical protein